MLPSTPHRQREERRVMLAQMTQDASDPGLYADTAEDYDAALKKARKSLARQEDAP